MIFSLQKIFSTSGKLGELIFFPSFCQLCSNLLESPQERIVCLACWDKVKAQRRSYCLCCGRFFQGAGEPHFCAECLKVRPPFSLHRSGGKYDGKLKDIILLFKYRHLKVLGKQLAQFAFFALREEEELWQKVDALLPVPLHPKRKKQRGFNQAQVLAEELEKIKGIKIEKGILIKVKNVAPQTSLVAEDRLKNVSGAFRVVKEDQIKGKKLLLIDDVYTTGATIRECSRVLKEAGAKEVKAITVARA